MNKDRTKLAVDFFCKGYNCAQSVACAYSDLLGISQEDAYLISAGMGGGIGGMRLTCGALSGAAIIAGLKYGKYDPNDNEKKTEMYSIISEIGNAFTEKFESNCCFDLLTKAGVDFSVKPKERTEKYYRERPCGEFVEYASLLLEKLVFNGDLENSESEKEIDKWTLIQ